MSRVSVCWFSHLIKEQQPGIWGLRFGSPLFDHTGSLLYVVEKQSGMRNTHVCGFPDTSGAFESVSRDLSGAKLQQTLIQKQHFAPF